MFSGAPGVIGRAAGGVPGWIEVWMRYMCAPLCLGFDSVSWLSAIANRFLRSWVKSGLSEGSLFRSINKDNYNGLKTYIAQQDSATFQTASGHLSVNLLILLSWNHINGVESMLFLQVLPQRLQHLIDDLNNCQLLKIWLRACNTVRSASMWIDFPNYYTKRPNITLGWHFSILKHLCTWYQQEVTEVPYQGHTNELVALKLKFHILTQIWINQNPFGTSVHYAIQKSLTPIFRCLLSSSKMFLVARS